MFRHIRLYVEDSYLHSAPKVSLFQALGGQNRWLSALLFWDHVTTHKLLYNNIVRVDNENRSGRLSANQIDENVICVSDVLNSDRQMSFRLLVDTLNI